ncbi:MAG: hypothetical protein L0Y66_22130, partial [Myxococcaceae bacterium]|nr:hypothetical protein [Myxococcaceae bacterium]
RWLAFPRVLWLALLGALLVSLPTLGMGFFGDDYAHLLMLEGMPGVPGGPFDLFRFTGGNPEGVQGLIQRGPYPWWTLPELKLAFWRPLSSALAVLDHGLFGRSAVGYHVHSVAWYLGLVAVLGVLLRRVLPGALGVLTLLLYAVDDAHALPVGWIANRNALVAVTPALVGLWMHLEWREAGRGWARPLSLVCLALGLTGGEAALGVFAYLLAYEALGARDGTTERMRAVVPAVLLGLVYVAAYKALGYGASGSGSYLDPLGEPLRFLAAAAVRVPALLSGLLLGAPVDLWPFVPATRPALVIAGVAGAGLFAWLLRAAWPALPAEERRHLRWLFVGAALSLVPVAATFPSGRLLLVPGLGGCAAVAVALRHGWRSWARREGRHGGLAVATGGLVLAHVVGAPLGWPVTVLAAREANAQAERMLQVTAGELDTERLPTQRLVVLPTPVPTLGMFAPMVWAARGHVLPRSWWTLSLSLEPHVLTRTGPSAFELSLRGGHFHTSEFEQLFRGPAHALPVGAQVQLDGMRVTVLEAGEEGPTRLGFALDVPLEDDSLVLLHWRDGGLRRLPPPAIGVPVAL